MWNLKVFFEHSFCAKWWVLIIQVGFSFLKLVHSQGKWSKNTFFSHSLIRRREIPKDIRTEHFVIHLPCFSILACEMRILIVDLPTWFLSKITYKKALNGKSLLFIPRKHFGMVAILMKYGTNCCMGNDFKSYTPTSVYSLLCICLNCSVQ